MWESLFAHKGWKQYINDTVDSLNDLPVRAFWQATSFEEILAARLTYQELMNMVAQEGYIDGRIRADLDDPNEGEAE